MAKTIVDDRARQGPRGRTVLYVLVASLVLAGIYLASLLIWSGNQTPASLSQPVTQSPSPASSNSSAVPAGNPNYPATSTNPNAPRP